MIAACVLLAIQAGAQSIRGVVRDATTRQVLSGATVLVENTGRATSTDEFGRFSILTRTNEEVSIAVKFIGYETMQMTARPGDELEIELKEGVTMTDEVIVFATRANEKTPAAYSNVNSRALQQQNFGQDMPILLSWTPSMVTTSDAGTGIGYTGLRIRGSDATRINVTINGIPYNDAESQGTFWVDIPDIASSTQSVQVQRGVGTSTNGAGAFGGSVNLQTNALQQDAYTELTVAGGSFNTQRYTLKAGTGLINGLWAFDAKASRIKSDGYIDRASADLNSYYMGGGYYGKKTIVKAIAFGGHEKTYQAWNGNDEVTMQTNRTFNSAGALYDENWNVIGYYDNEVDDYRQNHYQLHLSHQLGDAWNVNLSGHYTYGRGYYEQYKQAKPFAELGLPDLVLKDTTLTYGDFIVRKWLDNKFYGGTFSANYDKAKTNLTIGGAFNQYGDARHFGEILWAQYAAGSQVRQLYYDGESRKSDFNVYTKWNYSLSEALQAFVDVQYRIVEYKTAGVDSDQNNYAVDADYNFFNPKAGINYSLSAKDVLYWSIAVANREPARADFLDSPVTPRPERLTDVETGWRRSAGNYKVEANLYFMNYKDQLVLTGELDNVGNPIRANVGKSYRAGLELSGTVILNDEFTWNANATLSRSENIDYRANEADIDDVKNTTIAFSPGMIAGSQLSWSGVRNLQVTLLSKYVGEQFLDNTETQSLMLEGYLVNDVRVAYSFYPKGMKAIDVSLLVNNLLNEEYSSNGATYGDGVAYYYPQAGTNFLAMLTLRF